MKSIYIDKLRELEHKQSAHFDLSEAEQVRCCISKYLHKELSDKRYSTKQCLLTQTLKVTCKDKKKLIEDIKP